MLVWRLGIPNWAPGLTWKDKEPTCLAATVSCLRASLPAGALFFFAWGFIFRKSPETPRCREAQAGLHPPEHKTAFEFVISQGFFLPEIAHFKAFGANAS